MLGGGAADAALLGEEDGEERNPALGYSLDDDSRRVWDDSRPSRELCEAFSEWHWENNCFHDYVVEFAFAHKDALLDVPAGEHSHGVHGLHKEFSESLEGFVSAFLKDHGATMEQFGAALQEQKESGDLCTRMTVEVVTDEVFALMEYDAFHKTMLESLALEASAPGDSLVRDDAVHQSEEARELLNQLAVRDAPAAGEVLQELHAEENQRAIDAGGLE